MGIGIGSIVANPELREAFANTSIFTKVAAESLSQAEVESASIAVGEQAQNSGGPDESGSTVTENSEIDSAVVAIKQDADPDSLPTEWAHLGKINNEFGFRRNPFGGRSYEFHNGMDIDGERGDQVTAPATGTVIHAGYKGGYGNLVEIDHGNGLTSRYGHLSKIESEVGQTIIRGQLLGLVGSTGRSTGPHLHFELRLNDRPINPRHFLPPEPTDLSTIIK